MIYFFDTSAFVKRYMPEVGSDVVQNIFAEEENILVVSAITLVESFAVINRHLRKGSITQEEIQEALDGINEDWLLSRFSIAEVTNEHISRCQNLIFRFHLTSSDALILAAVLEMNILHAAPVFVCSDIRSGLLRAAEAEGLSPLNPLSPP